VEQRSRIITECVEGQISPMELARRYNVNADTIRAWVRKSGRTLPKTYRKLGSGEGGGGASHIRPSSPSLGGVGGGSSGGQGYVGGRVWMSGDGSFACMRATRIMVVALLGQPELFFFFNSVPAFKLVVVQKNF
jgi:hypothetical protein